MKTTIWCPVYKNQILWWAACETKELCESNFDRKKQWWSLKLEECTIEEIELNRVKNEK